MKLKRILAGVAAASVAVSALAVSAFAEDATEVFAADGSKTVIKDVELGPWDSQWVQSNDNALPEDFTNYEVVVKATSSGEYDADNNIALKIYQISGGAEDITVDGVAGMTDIEYRFDLSLAKTNEWNQVTFQVQAGHLPIVLNSVTLEEKAAEDPDVGTTDFSHGGIDTSKIDAEPGFVFKNKSGDYQLDVVNKTNDANLLGDAVEDVDNAKAIGVRFKVTDFNVGDPEMAVSLIANANTADGKNFYRWSDDEVNGVTVKSGKEDVATIKGNGEYIVWAVFDEAITYDESFLISLIGTLDETAPAAIADDEAVLPYTIEVLQVGVQEANAPVTPVQPDDESSNPEPTPENPGDEPTPEDPGDEPTTPGDSTEPDDNSSDDNSSDDNNGNTSVDDGGDNNPGTGVALAVVPAVLAAGALATATIVLKKRK